MRHFCSTLQKKMPFPHFVCLRAAYLALLSVMSRVGSRVQDLLPLCLPLVARNGRSNSPRLFLKARQWHYTVFAIGMLDIPRMGTVVFPVCHFFACMRHDAAGCQAGYLTKYKSKIESRGPCMYGHCEVGHRSPSCSYAEPVCERPWQPNQLLNVDTHFRGQQLMH